jgi:RNA polymerase sigma-70 factor (ECF subfamily)
MDLDDADERSLLRTGPNPTWEAALQRASAAQLQAAMEALPDEQRQAVDLVYFQGYTYREVAELTGVPPGTATGRLRLALGKLRAALAEPLPEPAAAVVGSPFLSEEGGR